MKISPLLLFLSLCSIVQAQKTDIDFSKFNLKKFQNLQEQRINHYFLEDSTQLKLEEYGNLYQLTVNLPKSHFSYSYQYFKSTLSLKRSGKFFQRNPIGTHLFYNLKGEITQKIENDTAFTFSLNQLDSLLIKDYEIYIMDKGKPISVSIEDSFIPTYNIAYSSSGNPFGMWRFIQFDGKTGMVMQDFEKAYECRAK